MKLFYFAVFTTLIFGIGNGKIIAQQTPIFNQYAYSPDLYNPARTGENGGNQLFFTHRQQWLGVDQAPSSQLFAFSARLPGDSPLALGLVAKNDRAGLMKRTDVALFSGYHIENLTNRFSVGIYLGFNSVGVATSESNVGLDPVSVLPENNQMKLDAGIGVNFQHKDEQSEFNIGLASHQLPGMIDYSGTGADSFSLALDNHVLATVSYKHALNDQMDIEPIVHFRTIPGSQKLKGGALDIHVRLHVSRLAFGIGVRPGSGLFGNLSVFLDEDKRSEIGGVADWNGKLGLGYEAAIKVGFGSVSPPPPPPSIKNEKDRTAYWNSTRELRQKLGSAGLAAVADVKVAIDVGGTQVAVSYPDESGRYVVQAGSKEARIVQWTTSMLKDVLDPSQNPHLERVNRIELIVRYKDPSSIVEADVAGVSYSGEFGEKLNTFYEFDGEQTQIQLEKGSEQLFVHEFSFLHLFDVRRAIAREMQIDVSQINISLEFEQDIDTSREYEIRTYLPPTK